MFDPILARPALALDPDAERALLAELTAQERHLATLLRDRGADVADPPDRQRLAWVERTDELARRLARRDPALRRAWRTLGRLRWRLALSGMDQVEFELRRHSYERVSAADLRQAGILGLHEAARRFEAGRGLRFSTYCRWWVRAAMGELVGDLEFVVRLPRAARQQVRHIGEEGGPSEAQQVALARVRDAVALEAPAGDACVHLDLLAAPAELEPDRRAARRRSLRRLQAARERARLSDRHQRILQARYGLDEGRPLTFRELGEELGVSGERVRQLERQALRRLREAHA